MEKEKESERSHSWFPPSQEGIAGISKSMSTRPNVYGQVREGACLTRACLAHG